MKSSIAGGGLMEDSVLSKATTTTSTGSASSWNHGTAIKKANDQSCCGSSKDDSVDGGGCHENAINITSSALSSLGEMEQGAVHQGGKPAENANTNLRSPYDEFAMEIQPMPSPSIQRLARNSIPGAYSVQGAIPRLPPGVGAAEEAGRRRSNNEEVELRLESSNNVAGLVEAEEVVPPAGHAVAIIEDAGRDGRSESDTIGRSRIRMSLVGMSCLTLVVIVIVVILWLLTRQNSNEGTSNLALPTDQETVASNSSNEASLLLPLIERLPDYTLVSLQDPFSPQSQAYLWLEQHPNILDFPPWRRRQLFAMATFYYAFDGPHWPLGIGRDWLDVERSECQWFSSSYGEFMDSNGFAFQHHRHPDDNSIQTCNDSGELTMIYLAYGANVGFGIPNLVIPRELSFLTSLRQLNLEQNGLVAASGNSNSTSYLPDLFPTEFYTQMTNLEILSLGLNTWNTQLPSQLGLLTKMTILKLDDGGFVGSIPSEVGLLSNMQHLSFRNNSLTGTIPSELENMADLIVLRLDSNNLTGTIPTKTPPSLHSFHVERNNRLSGVVPTNLCSLRDQNHCTFHNIFYGGSVGSQNDCEVELWCTDLLCGCDECPCSTP